MLKIPDEYDMIVMHSECKRPAFYYKGWGPGRKIQPKDAVFPNGEIPVPNTQIFCGSCHDAMNQSDMYFVSREAYEKNA